MYVTLSHLRSKPQILLHNSCSTFLSLLGVVQLPRCATTSLWNVVQLPNCATTAHWNVLQLPMVCCDNTRIALF